MPSPFPGMDPYIENTFRWRQFHGHFISDITYQLNAQLPQGIIAQYEERCYVMPFDDEIYPDAIAVESPSAPLSDGRTAVMERTETVPLIIKYASHEVTEPFIEVITADDEERVLTVIEFLSPTNKRVGIGRDEYTVKQSRVLNSESHLLEIDLLRAGEHTVAVRRERVLARKQFDYLVSLHRVGNRRGQFEVWPLTVRDMLPIVRVPLLPGMPDALLDLQPIMDGVYDRSAVGHRLKYRQEPEPPLPPSDAPWADALLREKGLCS